MINLPAGHTRGAEDPLGQYEPIENKIYNKLISTLKVIKIE